MILTSKATPTTQAKPHNRMKALRRLARQRGFTLIELMVVIGVIGALMAIIMPNIMNPSTKTDSMLLTRVAQSAHDSYSMINVSCSTTRSVENNQVADNSGTNDGAVEELIFSGILGNTAYEDCYERSGVSPNSGDVSDEGSGSTVNYLVKAQYPVEFRDGTSHGTASLQTRAFDVVFDNVAVDVAQDMARQFNSEFDLATSGFTGPVPVDADKRAPLLFAAGTDTGTYEVTRRFLW